MARSDDVALIVRNPDWFAYRYDPSNDAIQFIKVSRAEHRAAAFLRDEFLPSSAEPLPLGREEALAATPAPAPIHFIFHSAYCCSTLLARAFDVPGVSMGLKEPLILNDIVGWNHRGAERAQIARILDHSMQLLAKPFEPGEMSIIKPSNLSNGYIPAMLELRKQAKALLLYAPLETYLPSIAKKGLWGRLWVRTLLVNLIREGRIDLGFQPDQYLELSDLQVAAIGWLAQQMEFNNIVRRYGRERVATLNSEVLLRRKLDSMVALDALFGTGMSRAQIAEIVAGPAFNENSKTFESFGTDKREAETKTTAAAHADEIHWVTGWAVEVAKANAVPLDLPAPLLG